MNFVQYIDDTYTIKVKEVLHYGRITLKDIDTPFFVLALFIRGKRVDGVTFYNYDNLAMLSVINDLGYIDLNVISKSDFALAYSEIQIELPYLSARNNVEISNWEKIAPKFLRYVKEYNLPQFRQDGRFLDIVGYNIDSRVYAYLNLKAIQGQNKYHVGTYKSYVNNINLDLTDFRGEHSDSYINDGYQEAVSFPVQDNGSIVQFGDYYLKMSTTLTSYPYGLSVSVITDIRTNEFWLVLNYLENGTGISKKQGFDIDNLICVNGGFKIKNSLFGVEIQITNIYG